jgi:hypothetical protein
LQFTPVERPDYLYDREEENLECGIPDIIRLALAALNIRVYACPGNLETKGGIPLQIDLLTTGRTSGYRHGFSFVKFFLQISTY